MDINALLAGHVLALARENLPALSARAQVLAGDRTVEQIAAVYAALPRDRNPLAPTVRRVGDVAIVPLTGLVTVDTFLGWLVGGGTAPDLYAEAIEDAVADRTIARVITPINSPGGLVDLVPESAERIRAARRAKPIVAIARTLAASAAYWLGSQATSVYATASGQVGSVGCFVVHTDVSRLNDRLGLRVTYISSDPKKVELAADLPLADDAKAFVQGQIDRAYRMFVEDVAKGRRTTVARVRDNYGGGRIFDAEQALAAKMIDGIQPFELILADASPKGTATRERAAALELEEALARDREWLSLL